MKIVFIALSMGLALVLGLFNLWCFRVERLVQEHWETRRSTLRDVQTNFGDRLPVFVSYANRDAAGVSKALRALEPQFSVTAYDPGNRWPDAYEVMLNAIETALVVVHVKDAVTVSRYVQFELSYARKMDVPIVQLKSLSEDAMKKCIEFLILERQAYSLENRLVHVENSDRWRNALEAYESSVQVHEEDLENKMLEDTGIVEDLETFDTSEFVGYLNQAARHNPSDLGALPAIPMIFWSWGNWLLGVALAILMLGWVIWYLILR